MSAEAPRHETRSKVLFGNKHMLALCDKIARGDRRFTALDLAERSGVGYSSTHRLLATLATVGLVRREPRSAAEREQWYVRVRHSFWDAAQDLRKDPGRKRVDSTH